MRYKSLKDYVYEYISDKINDGSLKAKEKISESKISEDLAVSRTPVREALMQLSNEGYIERYPRRGFIVKELDLERVHRLYEVIGCLEGLAASLAIDKLTEKEMKSMEDILKEIDESIENRDYLTYYKLQTEFHNVFIKAADNEELFKILESLKKNFIRQTYITDKEKRDILFEVILETQEQHKEIHRLFKEKDKEKIERYLRDVHWGEEYAHYDIM